MNNQWSAMFPKQDGKVFIFDHYGIAPSVVLRNPDLSIGAKAVYSYLMTYVNSEQAKSGDVRAWPSRERMMAELGISVNTLTKYLRELKEAELISIEQTREQAEDGKTVYGRNIYVIHPYVPDPAQCHKNCDTEEEVSVTDFVTLKSCDTQKVNPSNTMSFSNTNSLSKTRQDKSESSPVFESLNEISATVESEPEPQIDEQRLSTHFELYVDRPPTKSELRTLVSFAKRYGTEWVEAAFIEYMVQNDLQEIKNPIGYVRGVLKNWSIEGMRLTDVLKHLRGLKG